MRCMLLTIDHVTLRSGDLARTERFYVELLGMTVGLRPSFNIRGRWLYVDGRALVHIVEAPVAGGEGAFDHLAFEARGRMAISDRLREADVPFELHALPDGSALQMFLRDPDGARIELVFKDLEDR